VSAWGVIGVTGVSAIRACYDRHVHHAEYERLQEYLCSVGAIATMTLKLNSPTVRRFFNTGYIRPLRKAQLRILLSCVYLPVYKITLVYFRLGYKIHRYGALRHQTHSR
jgi:hypothetical protein